jgi:hypothetical protein
MFHLDNNKQTAIGNSAGMYTSTSTRVPCTIYTMEVRLQRPDQHTPAAVLTIGVLVQTRCLATGMHGQLPFAANWPKLSTDGRYR